MSQERKDYYKILGITDEEKKLPWEEFISIEKSKYRKLARELHPDRQGGKSDVEKKAAEEKFKEVAEAHAVLSDKEKKVEYDNPPVGGAFSGNPFTNGGFNPFGGFDPFNFDMSSMFGGGSSRRQQRQQEKGASMRISVELTLEEIFNGTEKTVKYKRQEPCGSCHGSGLGQNGKVEMCPICGGTGMEMSINGSMQVMTTCRHCRGTGKIISNPCKSCGGSGLEPKEHEVTFTIPKGVVGDMEIVLRGEGGLAKDKNGIPGDLLVRIVEKPHDIFVRRGHDLLFELKIPILDAITGTKVNVTTIDGKTLSTTIQPGTEDGTNIKFANKGMPIYDKNNRFGHMIGIVKLVMPKKLNADEKRLLEELKEQEHFKS